jgi:ABC-type lipoprotein export system ATPase subunit
MSEKLFEIENLRCSYDKKYRENESRVVLEVRHLVIPRGHKVFIVGESGIGKSTILETLGMMNNTIVPDEDVRFSFYDAEDPAWDLKELWHQGDCRLSAFRLKHYSFIFQSTNLMKNFTAYENVAYTRMLQGYSRFSCRQRTRQLLADLGLEHVDEKRMAHELSGGQQQRLAFARAILPDFTVLFGDEPTGNLDAENAVRAMQILHDKLNDHQGATAIIVSHDMHLAVTFADTIIKIRRCLRPRQDETQEEVAYGLIDDSCVFTRRDDRLWTNGSESFIDSDFETFLRQK